MLLAINRNFVGRATNDVINIYNSAFEPVDIAVDELAALVSRGYAFCPQFNKKKRQSANFKISGYIAVDVDHGLTLEAAQASEFFQNYAALLYTTTRHTPEAHRFRIVFELDEPITDPSVMESALTGLIAKFGGDKSCSDACRFFFGSIGCEPIIHGKKLPKSVVDDLVLRGCESVIRTDNKNDKSAPSVTVASRIQLETDIEVETEVGGWQRLVDLPERTRVRCPVHIDNRPSAFTLRSKRGVPGVHCKSCNATFFVKQVGDQKPYRYDFDYSWNRILNLSYEEYTAHTDDNGLVSLSEVRGGAIRMSAIRYLPFEEAAVVTRGAKFQKTSMKTEGVGSSHGISIDRFMPDSDITFVKSPKGSGKTEWLSRLVATHKAAGNSILLIGHRRTLINSTANRLGLTSYLKMPDAPIRSNDIVADVFGDFTLRVSSDELDDPSNSGASLGYNEPTLHYAICLDSLPARLEPVHHKFDLILIDEVEQVFAHLLSKTLKPTRREVLLYLRHYLNSAKAVYLLDADLSRVTVEVMDALLNERKRSWQALINLPKPENRVLHFYESVKKDAMTGELIAALLRGERCFVATNSRSWTDNLSGKLEKSCNRPIKSIAISSKNSHTPEIQSFIRNIKQEAANYDLIITSPSMGTGIDITFADGQQLIDTVFGFFETRINTHFDIDQQLSRVRNPKRINVWISPETYAFETEPAVIQSEIETMEGEFQKLIDIDVDGCKVYQQDEAGKLYASVYASVSACRRASMNNLRRNFIALRESNGWVIEYEAGSPELSKEGKALREAKKAEDIEMRYQRILNAERLGPDDYSRLKKGSEERLTSSDHDAIERYDIESFYYCDATPELLKEDDNWKLRRAIRMYQLLMESDTSLKDKDRQQQSDFFHDKNNRYSKKCLLVDLLTSAGIFRDGNFDLTTEITAATLQEFAVKSIKSKPRLEELFNIDVRSDVKRNSVQQLSKCLKVLGLSLKKPRIDQSGGTKQYFYRLNEKALNRVSDLSKRNSDPELGSQWYDNRLLEVDPVFHGIETIQKRLREKSLSKK